MNERFTRIVEALDAAELAALAIVPGANLQYLLGLTMHMNERLSVAFFTSDGEIHLVLPALEEPRARAEAQLPVTFYPWHDNVGYIDALTECIDTMDLDGLIGVEYTAMRVLELRAIEELSPSGFVDADRLLGDLRMVKDEAELTAMRKAAAAVEAGLETAIAAIKPGVTEREIAAAWEQGMQRAGAAGPAFTTIVASGPNSANPHHTTGDRKLGPGDLVILDGGAIVDGYCSDITRTVALAPLDEELQRVYEVVKAANAAGVHAVKPGTTGEAIDRAARDVIVAAGMGALFTHRTGHGLGIETHELPFINTGEVKPLPAGTTFTVEPGVYLPERGGVRIEDDVVVTQSGGASLTSFNRALILIDR